jgi:hypothetical protein
MVAMIAPLMLMAMVAPLLVDWAVAVFVMS